MAKYGEDASCPKCGYSVMRDKYVPSVVGGVRDSIRRTCRRCEYSWHVRPLDADDEVEGLNVRT